MSKPVNLKKLTKHWNKVFDEAIKICMSETCSKCDFCIITNDEMFCSLGHLNTTINRLNSRHKYTQVELPEITVNEEGGEDK